MSGKKNPKTTSSGCLTALKIGSRVRCTDDGVTGRIVWANALAVKIRWDDGEEVTWKRESLASRPIAILDADAAEADQTEATAAEPEPAATAPLAAAPPAPTAPEPTDAVLAVGTAPTPEHAEVPASAPGTQTGEQVETTTSARPKRPRKAKAPAGPKAKKVSALDAAARVLAEAGQAMTTQELIGVMAAQGYWSSPGGQTPAATLYSALLREIATKGAQARFVKAAPGRFAFRTTV